MDRIEVVRRRLLEDTPFWAEHCATILDERKRRVRLVPRPWQLTFDAAMEKQRQAGQPVRIIILKARKLGFSTWVQAKFTQRVTQMESQYAIIVAHEKPAAGVLMDMAKLMHSELPDDRQLAEMLYGEGTVRGAPFSIKPPIAYEGQSKAGNRWMTFGDRRRMALASTYETRTAGAKGGGRATTPSMLHASEAAHYEDPGYLVGMLNAVPKVEDTIVVIESTANGFNHFETRWRNAVDGAEDPDTGGMYVPLFFGWQDNPANSIPFNSPEARARFERTIGDPDGGGDEEEPDLIAQFGVSLEQLRWRRVTRDEECGGDVQMFHQEHPATPEQAFIGSGDPVFPGIRINRAIAAAQAAERPVAGVLRPADVMVRPTRSGTIEVPQRALWVPELDLTMEDADRWGPTSPLLVWEHPLKSPQQIRSEYATGGMDAVQMEAALEQAVAAEERGTGPGQYVVFVDVAEGSGEPGDPDYSVIQVVDHVSRMQVARYRSRIAIHDLPLLCMLVGLYYNEAWLAVEKNALGVGVVDSLGKDYRYRRMYRTHRPGDEQRAGPMRERLGWATSPRTKPLMEQTFGELLKSEEHGLRDVATARELTTYVRDPNNPAKHGALKGSHDDLLMAYMGAQRVAAEMRPRDLSKKKKPRPGFDSITGY